MLLRLTKIIKRATLAALKALLLNAGFLGMLFLFGCAQNSGYQNKDFDSTHPRASEGGLVSSGRYYTVAIADMDNDGNMDVIGGGDSPGTVAIWYGDNRGRLSEPQFLPIKGDVRSLATADFDEDGLKDIVLSIQRESSGIVVVKNQSNRKWVRGIDPIKINNYQGVHTADVNEDGHVDIIAANATSDIQGGIQIWLGDGKGNWLAESGPTVTGIFMDVALADFNEDGTLDLAGAGWGTYGALKIWLGDGAGDWSFTSSLNKGSYYGLSVGDVNRDGHIDIIAGTYRAGIQIFLGNGKGGFIKGSSPKEDGSFWQVLPVNLDEDGHVDLLASSLDSNGIMAWRSEGPNSWSPIKGRFPTTGTIYGLAMGDLNKDNHNDILAASFGEGIKLWVGKGGVPVQVAAKEKQQVFDSDILVSLEELKENEVFTITSGFPEYKVGPNDILEITLWKGSVGTKKLTTVRPDGRISFGLMDDIYVKGLTANSIDDLITKHLKEYIKAPRLDVLVKEHKSKFVTILGAGTGTYERIGRGKYPLTGRITVLEMLSDTGILHRDANLSKVSLRRKNGEALILDLYKAIFMGETGQDVVLDDGDMIYIPIISKESNRVYVFGEVKKPGVYSFSGYEMRLMDAISQAGGVTVFATEKSTKIVRGNPTRPEVISANLKMLMEKGDQTQNIALANGDLVYVPRSFVGSINLFVKRISPILQLIYAPATFRDEYMSGEAWRLP